MSALKVDDALQAIAALQQENTALLVALKAMEVAAMRFGIAHDPARGDDEFFHAMTEQFAAIEQARIAIAHAERAK